MQNLSPGCPYYTCLKVCLLQKWRLSQSIKLQSIPVQVLVFVLFEAAVPDLVKSFTGVFTVVLEKHLSVVSFPESLKSSTSYLCQARSVMSCQFLTLCVNVVLTLHIHLLLCSFFMYHFLFFLPLTRCFLKLQLKSLLLAKSL